MPPPKKKILFVITKSNWGGAQKYVYDLATNLPQDRYEVAVAFGGTGGKGTESGLLNKKLSEAGIRTIFLQSFTRDISIIDDFRIIGELRKLFLKEKPDIVHLNSSKAGGVGALAGRLAHVPHIVFTAHGWAFWEKRNAIFRLFIWFFSWLTILFSHTIIVISNYDLRVAQRMPFSRNKLTRIYNGIDSIDFLPPEPSDTIRVLTTGELNQNKNLFVGIDSILKAREKGALLSYAIMSDGELKEQIETYIKEKKASDFIHLLGFVPEGKRHYKNFDIFFLPSKKEGIPYVILEAGLAEIPVIASNVGGIPEIISTQAEGILKKPDDTEGFANALVTLAQNSTLRKEMGHTLKEKVERVFSVDQMLYHTLHVYEMRDN